MSSLADSFIEDLDELDDEHSSEDEVTSTNPTYTDGKHEELVETSPHPMMSTSSSLQDNTGSIDATSRRESELMNGQGFVAVEEKSTSAGDYINRLRPTYLNHLESIRAFSNTEGQTHGASHPDIHQAMATSNDLMLQIDDEIQSVHRYVADAYALKFSELESLVPASLDYFRVVKIIQNASDISSLTPALSQILPSATIMGISVTASTTSGKNLSLDDLERVTRACDAGLEMAQDRRKLLTFVQHQMTTLAPNVSAMLGAQMAAQVIGLAGGLDALARTPACNIQVLGQSKSLNKNGFSSASALKNIGLIYHSDLVMSCPAPLRSKAVRALAGKVTLAARVDASRVGFNTSTAPSSSSSFSQVHSSNLGQDLRHELEIKFLKWQEPDRAKTKRALPRPDEKPKRKRGGRRYRKMKEKLEMTQVRKEMNRESFASTDAEYGESAMGQSFGRLGQAGSGSLRVRTKRGMGQNKKHPHQPVLASHHQSSSNTSSISGLASSLAFTPVQGIELMNPEAAQAKVREANRRYFGVP